MKEILQLSEIVVSILLIASVMLQQRGTGIGGAFGGESFAYRGRRGVEQFLFRSTIILAAVFIGIAIALLLVVRS